MTRYHRLLALSAFLLFCINVMADGRFAMRSSNRAISSIAVNRTFSVSSVFSPVSHTNQISGLSISGNITNAQGKTISTETGTVNVTLGSDCTWTLTADTYITSFTGDASCIKANGHRLFVNGKEM